MTEIWRYLSGEVPGGFSVPVVLLIVFFPMLEYVYRTGETMHRNTYKRWRWLGPVIILAVYTLFWIQSPPKLRPVRIAILPVEDAANESNWQVEAVADLTARTLRKSFKSAIVNPWTGALEEYPAPILENLNRSKYRVYQTFWGGTDSNGNSKVTVIAANGKKLSCFSDNSDLLSFGIQISSWILEDLNENVAIVRPFLQNPDPACLEDYYRGINFLSKQFSDSAIWYFNSAIEDDSSFTPAHLGMAQATELSGDISGAESELFRAVNTDTSSLEALLQMGEFYLRQYQWEKAEPPLKVALARDPLQVRAYQDLTLLHPERLKDLRLDTKILLLEEAVRLDPVFVAARISLAEELIKTSAAFKARKYLQDGLLINPNSIPLLLKMGAVELYDGNSDKSKEIYHRILDISPENASAAFNLGVVNYRLKDYDSAEINFKLSAEWGGTIDNYYYLGLIYRAKGDTVKAIDSFNTRWELRKDDDDIYALKAKEYAEALD